MPRVPSLHTHSRYCDGAGDVQDYVEAALAAGLPALGASGHAPVPWPTDYAMPLDRLPAYVAEVQRLRGAYAGRIDVYLGLELDYRPGVMAFYRDTLAPYPFDYLIGSVHYVGELDDRPWAFEASPGVFADGVRRLYGGFTRRLVADYYALVREAAQVPEVSILGHIDRLKMYNVGDRYFSEDAAWYRDAVEETLAAIAASGKIVELNTSGWRKANPSPFPSPWIARRCAELGIPMCLSGDSHMPQQVTYRFREGAALLRDAGHREVVGLVGGQWTPIGLRAEG